MMKLKQKLKQNAIKKKLQKDTHMTLFQLIFTKEYFIHTL